jgi:hypothetical protein
MCSHFTGEEKEMESAEEILPRTPAHAWKDPRIRPLVCLTPPLHLQTAISSPAGAPLFLASTSDTLCSIAY